MWKSQQIKKQTSYESDRSLRSEKKLKRERNNAMDEVAISYRRGTFSSPVLASGPCRWCAPCTCKFRRRRHVSWWCTDECRGRQTAPRTPYNHCHHQSVAAPGFGAKLRENNLKAIPKDIMKFVNKQGQRYTQNTLYRPSRFLHK